MSADPDREVHDGLRARMATGEERLRILEAWFRPMGRFDELERGLAQAEDRIRTLELALRSSLAPP